jgi:lipopolysaccharide export system permease protein
MRPYFVSALILAGLSFYVNNYLIPKANKKRLAFEEKYYRDGLRNYDRNIHRQVQPGQYLYMESFSTESDIAYKFSLEKFEGKTLKSKLISDFAQWDTIKNKWTVKNYVIHNYNGIQENIITGSSLDTNVNIYPSDFKTRDNFIETMNLPELSKYIEKKKLQGVENIDQLILYEYQRLSSPFAAFILTLIGVSLSSRKVRGGTGTHMGLGMLLSATYILFSQISNNLALGSGLNLMLAVWIPNIIFLAIGIYLYLKAPK